MKHSAHLSRASEGTQGLRLKAAEGGHQGCSDKQEEGEVDASGLLSLHSVQQGRVQGLRIVEMER